MTPPSPVPVRVREAVQVVSQVSLAASLLDRGLPLAQGSEKMLKLLMSIASQFTLLLFLALNLGDCLRWYTLPLSSTLHRSLFAGMVILSLLICLTLVRNLKAMRQISDKARLKFVSAPAETETKFEGIVRWSWVSALSALCCYACTAIWGGIYLSNGPYVGSGYAALLVLVAYQVTGITAAFRVERIKRSLRPRRAKARPEQPSA